MPTLSLNLAFKGGLAFEHLQTFTTTYGIKGEERYGHPNRWGEKIETIRNPVIMKWHMQSHTTQSPGDEETSSH